MKKVKITITHSYIAALVPWMENVIYAPRHHDYEEMLVSAVLSKWVRSESIRMLAQFPFKGEKKLTLKLEVAIAMAAFIRQHDHFQPADYMGNFLQKTYGLIDQQFAENIIQ